MKSTLLPVLAAATVLAVSPASSARVLADGEAPAASTAQAHPTLQADGLARKKRCNFSRGEKWGMFLWLFPPAGAIWTGVTCKKDVV